MASPAIRPKSLIKFVNTEAPFSTRVAAKLQKLQRSMKLSSPSSLGKKTYEESEDLPGKAWWILHPDSRQRYLWDILTAATTLFLAWRIPFAISFSGMAPTNDDESSSAWYYIDTFTDILYLCDITLNFFTGYHEDVNVVMDPKKVALKYVKTYFFFDALGSIPFELFFSSNSDGLERRIIKSSIRYLKIPKLLRLARIVKLVKKYMQYMYTFQVCMAYLSCIHWVACIWAGAGFVVLDDFPSVYEAYCYCLYTSVALMLNLDSVDDVSYENQIYCALFSILGAAFSATLIGSMTSIILTTSSRAVEYQEKVKQVMTDLKSMQVPLELRTRTKAYYDLLWRIKRTSDHFEQKIYQDEDLNPVLRNEIALHVYQNLISSLPLFKDCPDSCIAAVVMKLKTHLYMENDVVFYRKDPATDMQVIAKGKVNVLHPDDDQSKVMVTLGEGSFFGEMGLIRNMKRTSTVVAATFCELKSLSQSDAVEIFALYPVLLKRLTKDALTREATNGAMKAIDPKKVQSAPKIRRPESTFENAGTSMESLVLDRRNQSFINKGRVATFKEMDNDDSRISTECVEKLRKDLDELTKMVNTCMENQEEILSILKNK